jgi:aqualysin 1
MTAHSWRRLFVALAAAGAAFAAAGPAQAAGPHEPGDAAPVTGTERPTAIPDQYIVVFKAGTSAANAKAAKDKAGRKGSRIRHEYGAALNGFAATLSREALDEVRRDANVAYVEADQTVRAVATQSPATWGLDRIDQRTQPLSNSYTYEYDGMGVTAYVVDTGIRFAHNEFGGRAVTGFDAIDGGSADDCNGHGTHVAGTIGGTVYGVAKRVRLVGVRVLDCQGSGTNAQVIAGVNWVTHHHTAGQSAVANMSLGVATSIALDSAVTNSIADGVTYVVAAGNDNGNACNISPARVAAAVTVGATTSSDARSWFSNHGTCLDIFAPGSAITSAWHTTNIATNTISGTSMASPHVAGAAALVLQRNPSAAPSVVRDTLISTATTGVVADPGASSPNRLLYTLGTSSPPPPPPPPPPGCSSLPYVGNGTLSGAGDQDHHPNGSYFHAPTSGTHRGCLNGPSTADFDLYLQKWNGFAWSTVASGVGTTSNEDVTYNGTVGYYTWRVVSYSGSGNYLFGMVRP